MTNKGKRRISILEIVIILVLLLILFFELSILFRYISKDDSTIEICGTKVYLLKDNINELNLKKDVVLLGNKKDKSSLQVLRKGKHEAELIDSANNYRGSDKYEVDITKNTRFLGEQLKLLKDYFWIGYVVFVLFSLVYFIILRDEIKNISTILIFIIILGIIITTGVLINNIGYIDEYSYKESNLDYGRDVEWSKFIVTDDIKTWKQEDEISIFNNKFYSSNKIAPGVYSDYRFKVENHTDRLIKYNLVFKEENEYDVNLMYNLKRNGEYVYNDYRDIEGLNSIEISPNKEDEYIIEWKWIDHENDTYIGENAEKVIYNLKVQVNATQE